MDNGARLDNDGFSSIHKAAYAFLPVVIFDQGMPQSCIVHRERDHEPFRDVRLGEDDGVMVLGIGDDQGCQM